MGLNRRKRSTTEMNAAILTNAVRVLGHEPITCPADYATGICRIRARDAIFPDYRLQNLADQFGLDWAWDSSDLNHNYWVLTS